MIQVTLPGKAGKAVLLNPHLIEYAERIGSDRTALILTTGKRFVVVENPQRIRELVIDYRRRISGFVQRGGEE